jgi:hypothetical protein
MGGMLEPPVPTLFDGMLRYQYSDYEITMVYYHAFLDTCQMGMLPRRVHVHVDGLPFLDQASSNLPTLSFEERSFKARPRIVESIRFDHLRKLYMLV